MAEGTISTIANPIEALEVNIGLRDAWATTTNKIGMVDGGVCQIGLIWPPKPSFPATSAITMEEVVAKGTIASFTNGVGKIIELTGCTIAVKPLVSKLGLEGRFRFDDSRTIGLVSEDLRLT